MRWLRHQPTGHPRRRARRPGPRRHLPHAGAWTLILLAAGCSGPAQRPLLVISGPTAITSFEVRDGEAVLWRIASQQPIRLVALTYGVVPAGFEQSVPAAGLSPRPFAWGEPIVTETRSSRRSFLHLGFADGPRSIAIVQSEMRFLVPLEPEAVADIYRRHPIKP